MNRDVADDDGSAVTSESTVLPLAEEQARIEKHEVSTGKVRIRTLVETVEENVRAELSGEEVQVTRVPVDRVVTEAPAIRTEGDVTVIAILEEVLFVEKRLVLKEELHIRRRVSTDTVEVPVVLRKERAVVERVPPEDDIPPDEE